MISEIIRQYQKEGLSIFPVPYKTKKAIDKWKEYQLRMPTDAEIKSWFNGHLSNVAVICGQISGNLVVLDCDSHEKYAELTMVICDKLGIADVTQFTRVSQTAKGYHIWIRTKDPVKSQKFPALDIKGEGGYIIAPPSKHPSGTDYQLLNDLPIALIEDLKDIGINIEQKPNTSTNQPEWVSQLLDQGSPEGMRNDMTAKLAGYFRDRVPIDVTERILLDWNRTKNTPSLPDSEVLTTIGSIYRKPENPPRPPYGDKTVYNSLGESQTNTKHFKNISENISKTCNETKNISNQDILDWIEDSSGWFEVSELDRDLDVRTSQDKNVRRIAMCRLTKDGVIEKHKTKNKLYRKIVKNLRKIDFKTITSKSPLDIRLPFNMHRLVNTYPGNIIVVAGSPDSGKTGLLLNIIKMNMHKFGIYYYSSEMGELELNNRLSKFEGIEIDDWTFECEECSSNFSDAIRPDCINIIDYLELNDEVYRVAENLKNIHDKLGSGIAIVAIQKKIGAPLGRGAEFSLEKPRLYLSMDSGITIIQKAKNWVRSDTNPNKLQIKYKIVGGCKFVITQDWHYYDRLAPEWVSSLNQVQQGYTKDKMWE